MSSPYNHGIQTGSMLPSIYYDPELNKQLRTAHILFQDNYEKYFKDNNYFSSRYNYC